jgi:diguanylate cyclase (GGDEF)-like protein
MEKNLAGGARSPDADAQGKSPIEARQGRSTIAGTLKIVFVFVLLAFVGFMFVSYLGIHSIDESFGQVVEIDRPSLQAATEMDDAADEAMITFLESLVTDKEVWSLTVEVEFAKALDDYQALVNDISQDELSESASQLFGRLEKLGGELVASDQTRRSTFINLQAGFEEMDDRVEEIPFLADLEGDVEENARMSSNYQANPTEATKAEAMEEFAEWFEELDEFRESADRPSQHAALDAMYTDVRGFERDLLLIISLTEQSARTLPQFLSISSELDEVLEDGIYAQARTNLTQRDDQASRTVESSKSVLIASLVVGLLLGLGGLIWVRRRITRPVNRLMSQIRRQGAADGTSEADLDQSGEFGVLARALADAESQRAALEEELRRQALEDPLTGLANRTLFKDRVEHALNRRRDDGKAIGVAFLDLDDFKTVNDSLGHAAGDELLVTVAQRIKESVRTSDTVARLGGDEFAVLLDDVEDVAVPAHRILQALAKPISLEGKPVTVHGSVGIALHESGQTAADLLRNADVAMYKAKGEGKGGYKAFDETMHGAAIERFDLKNELLAAVTNDEFRLHYQPIMDLSTGRRKAVEALIRWEHPLRGTVSPGSFIPLAEETGAIVPIGRWVLNTACEQVAEWRQSPDSSDLRLCVNVSPSQLGDSLLVSDVSRALKKSGLPAEALVLEITESAFLLSDEQLAATIGELAALGVVIALDDFGSGYSSLGYLSKLPIGILKIDLSFVSRIDQGPEEAAVAQAIIMLGHTLGLEIVAEGIETPAQLAELRRRDCPLGQGFLLGRPAPPQLSPTLVHSVA